MFLGLVKNKLSKYLFLYFFLFLLASFAHGAKAATLYFSPSSKNVNVGDIVKISVILNTGGEAVNNAEATVSFPTDMLDVVSVSKGSVFSLWVEEPSFSNGAGTVSFNGGIPTPGYTGSAGTLISATFRAKKAGVASIYFSYGSIRANDGLGTDILSGMGQAQLTLVSKEEKPEETKPTTPEKPKEETKPESNLPSPMVSSAYSVNSFDLNISIYNPAKISQKFPYKIYLPRELKTENIIDNGGFDVRYDEEKKNLVASLDFDLAANATVKKTIRFQNVWYFSEYELNSIKNEAAEYFAKLDQSQYLPQALILKNEINSQIEKIITTQRSNFTSAEKQITGYQDNLDQLLEAKKNLEALRTLWDRFNNASYLQGFASSFQINTASIIILILAILLTILALLLVHVWRQQKAIKKQLNIKMGLGRMDGLVAKMTRARKKTTDNDVEKNHKKSAELKVHPHTKAVVEHLSSQMKIYFSSLLILVLVLLLALFYWLFNFYSLVPKDKSVDTNNTNTAQSKSLPASSMGDIVQASSTIELTPVVNNTATSSQYVLVGRTPAGWLNVRSEPSKTATITNRVHDGDKLEVSATQFQQNGEQYSWYNIIYPDNKVGWIYGQYVEEVKKQ